MGELESGGKLILERIYVTEIRIKNRANCCGERLAKTKVFVSGKLCGSLPDITKSGKWYRVHCYLTGREVKLVTVQDTYLSIQGIEVIASERGEKTSNPFSHKLVIHNKDVSQSSAYLNDKYPAKNALENKFTVTNKGVGMWWRAQFAQEYDFTKVRIKNRANGYGDRLA